MANQSYSMDKGVSIAIPEGYSLDQIRRLAGAVSSRFYWFYSDHGGLAYQINKEKTLVTVFSVN